MMRDIFRKILITIVAGVIVISLSSSPVTAQWPVTGIQDTKHNLSVSGPGTIKSTTEDRICIFCHAPHRARRDTPPLWNRADSTANYTPYQSSTLYASVGQPTGASKLCLSCHDGTIALGALVSEFFEIPFAGGIRFMPAGRSNLDTNLSDDHPVSFVYNNSLAGSNGELRYPSSLPPEIQLDNSGEMQCTACHDPHIDKYGKFLVLTNSYSQLCTSCHNKNGWTVTSHSLSGATWNGASPDPWPHTWYTTVAENGCENCHRPHTAGGHERLLNYAFEEDNCLVCHNGNVALKNIEQEITKPYAHAVQDYTGLHDAAENFSLGNVPVHVECADCHNPHWSNNGTSPGPPQVSGPLDGVSGISSSGTGLATASNQYEICYKCHADNNVISVVQIDRQLQQLNTRLEFDISSPSYHPVEAAGVNPNVPSLLPPYTTSSIIFCTDCHNNDDPTGPKGVHGSINRFLLELNYSTQDLTTESSYNYALCYKCHDRNSILSNVSFQSSGMGGRGGHSGHLSGKMGGGAPCSACHDPHGVSSTQGTPLNNSHLINFDISIVQPNNAGILKFEDLGTFSGQCFLKCHGYNHNPAVYP